MPLTQVLLIIFVQCAQTLFYSPKTITFGSYILRNSMHMNMTTYRILNFVNVVTLLLWKYEHILTDTPVKHATKSTKYQEVVMYIGLCDAC